MSAGKAQRDPADGKAMRQTGTGKLLRSTGEDTPCCCPPSGGGCCNPTGDNCCWQPPCCFADTSTLDFTYSLVTVFSGDATGFGSLMTNGGGPLKFDQCYFHNQAFEIWSTGETFKGYRRGFAVTGYEDAIIAGPLSWRINGIITISETGPGYPASELPYEYYQVDVIGGQEQTAGQWIGCCFQGDCWGAISENASISISHIKNGSQLAFVFGRGSASVAVRENNCIVDCPTDNEGCPACLQLLFTSSYVFPDAPPLTVTSNGDGTWSGEDGDRTGLIECDRNGNWILTYTDPAICSIPLLFTAPRCRGLSCPYSPDFWSFGLSVCDYALGMPGTNDLPCPGLETIPSIFTMKVQPCFDCPTTVTGDIDVTFGWPGPMGDGTLCGDMDPGITLTQDGAFWSWTNPITDAANATIQCSPDGALWVLTYANISACVGVTVIFTKPRGSGETAPSSGAWTFVSEAPECCIPDGTPTATN